MDSPASQPERADAIAPGPSDAAPRRRRRRLLGPLGERTAQLAYIGLWAGIFLLAGVVSAGATFAPFFHREQPARSHAEPTLPAPPERILDRGLQLPAKVVGEEIRVAVNGVLARHFWAGVDLGASVPGHAPGELAATRADYDRWLAEMGALGVTVVRVYTILGPAFYDALREYNLRHPEHPLYVLHGVWIPEDRFTATRDAWNRQVVRDMRREIRNAVAAVHGDAVIPGVPGHASGIYRSDISPWLMGWSFGIEWDPASVRGTDRAHAGRPPHRGRYVSATAGATPMESWIAASLDLIASEEAARGLSVPLTFTNWSTTDPLRHPEEPLPAEDLVSIDAMHMRASADWPGGLFASLHAYPTYPDFLRWQPSYLTYRRPRDGTIDPYAGYIHDLRRHFTGIPLMVTEFGQPTSLGCAHLAPLGRDQGCHGEREAAPNIVDMMRDIHDEGLAGAVVFMWLDEWFKSTWNTGDYELPRARRALWRSVYTNEEHFGIVAAEPGPRDLVVLDGRDAEWDTIPPTAAGTRSIRQVAATSDAENVYLRLRVTPDVWMTRRIVIGLDARPGGNRGLPGLPGVDPQAEMAVVIEPGGEARMYHAGWVEALGRQFGINQGYLPTRRADVLFESGAWVGLRQLLSRPYRIPSTGRLIPTQVRDASLLPWGTTDPARPDFDDRHLIDGHADVLEMALPWAMLSMADPSSHQLVVVGLDGTVTTTRTAGLGISVAVAGEPLLRAATYRWDGWDTVEWHERRKAGWPLLRRAFHRYLSSLGPRR